jgi:hypothetical protein
MGCNAAFSLVRHDSQAAVIVLSDDRCALREAPEGAILAKTFVLRRGQCLSAYKVGVAEQHNIPIRWE